MISPGKYIVSNGTYTGDGSANRPIAHKLGRIPQAVMVKVWNAGTTYWNFISDPIRWIKVDAASSTTATTMDKTYFYLEATTGNVNLSDYVWVAW